MPNIFHMLHMANFDFCVTGHNFQGIRNLTLDVLQRSFLDNPAEFTIDFITSLVLLHCQKCQNCQKWVI